MTPLVSIVLATYERPDVLRLAIESARGQTLRDWELLVVGDACGPATGQAVAACGDPRVRYLNLDRNCGEQSGPNNVGIATTTAPHVAFLNHDDLWLPDHLQAGLDALRSAGADLVFPLTAVVLPAAEEELARGGYRTRLLGQGRDGRYDPVDTFAPASSWILRREAATRVGAWRPARECVAESSRDFLFRAWRAGLSLRALPWISVVAFPSGLRDRCYRTGGAREQARFLARLADPEGLRRELEARAEGVGAPGRRLLGRALLLLAAHAGISPATVVYRARGVRKGEWIETLRRRRGLPPLDGARGVPVTDPAHEGKPYVLGRRISFRRGGDGPAYQAGGWSLPERWGTWAEGDEAGLHLPLARPPRTDLVLSAVAQAHLGGGGAPRTIEVVAGDVVAAAWRFEPRDNRAERTARLPASAAADGTLSIRFRMPGSVSPASLGRGDDARRLGLGVVSLTVSAAAG